MSRDGPSRNFMANGLHYNCKGRAKFVFLERTGLDCGLHCTRVGMRDCFRLEWCRHCLLWLIHFPCPYDLLNRPQVKWIPMVSCKHKSWSIISFIFRVGIL